MKKNKCLGYKIEYGNAYLVYNNKPDKLIGKSYDGGKTIRNASNKIVAILL